MATARQRGIRALVTAVGIVVIAAILSVWLGHYAVVNSGAPVDPEKLRREDAMTWVARALLVLSAAWIVIGMIAARTTLVRRPGAAAARATWLASSRPWRARESILGVLGFDRMLMIVVPTGLLIATCAMQTSFLLPWPIVLIGGAYLVFGVTVLLMVAPRSPWPAISAIGGVVVAQCMLVLVGSAVDGPTAFWIALWTTQSLRIVVFTVGLALLVWTAVAAGGAMTAQVGRRRSTGIVLVASGLAVLIPSLVTALIGVQEIGAAWQERVVKLTMPESVIWVAVAIGAVLVVAGLVVGGRRPAVEDL